MKRQHDTNTTRATLKADAIDRLSNYGYIYGYNTLIVNKKASNDATTKAVFSGEQRQKFAYYISLNTSVTMLGSLIYDDEFMSELYDVLKYATGATLALTEKFLNDSKLQRKAISWKYYLMSAVKLAANGLNKTVTFKASGDDLKAVVQ